MTVDVVRIITFTGATFTLPNDLVDGDGLSLHATGNGAPDMALQGDWEDNDGNFDPDTGNCDLGSGTIVGGNQGISYTIRGTDLTNVEGIIVVMRSAPLPGHLAWFGGVNGFFSSFGLTAREHVFQGDNNTPGPNVFAGNFYRLCYVAVAFDNDPDWDDQGSLLAYNSGLTFPDVQFEVTKSDVIVGDDNPLASTQSPSGSDILTNWDAWSILAWDQQAPIAPIITSVTPTHGVQAGGTAVTIAGSSFTGATSVDFGGVTVAAFTVVNDNTITTTSPLASQGGAVHVHVATAGGTSTETNADVFTYTQNLPAVTSLSPTHGPAGGGTTVIITGTTFQGATAVSFGAAPAASFVFNSATQITAVSPAGAGIVDVTVTTAIGASPVTVADRFTYDSSGPTGTIYPAAAGRGATTAVTSASLPVPFRATR